MSTSLQWPDGPQTLELFANVLIDAHPRHAEFEKDGSSVWVTSEVGAMA